MKINNQTLIGLRKEFGEAYYLLDSEQFRNNFLELKKVFSEIYPHFNIAYSFKTNYTPKLCRIVKKLGGYAEVVSEMELEIARRVGFPAERIIWNGPIKNPIVTEDFLLDGGTVNIDSKDELEILRKIVFEYADKKMNLGIRCNYDVNDGVISRFGFDINSRDFDEALNFCTKTPNVRFINFQCHFAKRQIKYWPARAEGMLELLAKTNIIPQRIDIGGGLFGKMSDSLKAQFSDPIPSYSDYAEAVASQFRDFFASRQEKPELIIEPGSAVVGDCMKFISTVKTIKNVRGKWFATLMASQKNISMSGVNPPIDVYHTGSEQTEYKNMDLVGYTCIEGDVMYHDYSGLLGIGDTVIFNNCGSYSIVMKPPFILPNFPIIDICGGSPEVIKRAESFDDLFHTYTF